MNDKPKVLNSPKYDISLLKSVGEDVFISASVEIRRPELVSVGKHVAIDTGFYLTTEAEIGGAKGLLRMGNFTNIALGSKIICVSDRFLGDGLITAPGIPSEFTSLKIRPVLFENFANVGANVVVMPGVRLGEGSVVGACSLVTRDTEPWTIYTGVPAKPIKKRPKEIMLKFAAKLGYKI